GQSSAKMVMARNGNFNPRRETKFAADFTQGRTTRFDRRKKVGLQPEHGQPFLVPFFLVDPIGISPGRQGVVRTKLTGQAVSQIVGGRQPDPIMQQGGVLLLKPEYFGQTMFVAWI